MSAPLSERRQRIVSCYGWRKIRLQATLFECTLKVINYYYVKQTFRNNREQKIYRRLFKMHFLYKAEWFSCASFVFLQLQHNFMLLNRIFVLIGT